MENFHDKLEFLIESRNPESFYVLSDHEKKYFAVEAINDHEKFDFVDIFLYRSDSFKTILNKKLSGQMTDEQVVKRIFDILISATATKIDEIMDDIRSDMLIKRSEDTL